MPSKAFMSESICLPGKFENHEFFHVTTTGSTNDDLKRFLEKNGFGEAIILADQQTSGRGQYGRKWLSRPGQSLMFSFSANGCGNEFPPSLLAGICVFKTLLSLNLSGVKLWLKWPNDVWYGRSKLAGVLTEAIASGAKMKLIIGVGLNLLPLNDNSVNSISLSEIGVEVSPGELLKSILSNWAELSAMPDRKLRTMWQECAGDFWNHSFEFLDARGMTRIGKPIEIDDAGVLKMQDSEGCHQLHSASLNLM